ncbi:MAG: ATPase [Bacteroidales bacterium]|nr:ATPase [Bacteroidales bacterium]
MNLIVDSGATKSIWCIADGTWHREINLPGINFSQSDPVKVGEVVYEAIRSLRELQKQHDGPTIDHIYVYGAGIVSEASALPLHLCLERMLPGVPKEYASDLLGAARAVCGREPGIATILGTGSNTCQWDGAKIVDHIDCGGFILGDEGGAAVLGKLFLADYLKGLVPEELAKAFKEQFQADYPAIVRHVYREEAPARYLGSIAPFVHTRYEQSAYVRELMHRHFDAFFQRTVLRYDASLPVGVIGGFGYACRELLVQMGAGYGITFSKFYPTPMEGLIAYHAL